MIDLKRNLFKIDVRAQKDEEKVFMRTACLLAKDFCQANCFMVQCNRCFATLGA
ncbi:hypothetical protein ACQH05_07400 [Streptococcus pyogenes]|nr:hypothetical protein [Streptococcus pyogenes]